MELVDLDVHCAERGSVGVNAVSELTLERFRVRGCSEAALQFASSAGRLHQGRVEAEVGLRVARDVPIGTLVHGVRFDVRRLVERF